MRDAKFDIPSISTLIAFEATARLGGATRAAEELATTSSVISRHITRLETSLGAKLFQRSGRGLVLTKSGEDYFSIVQSSMRSLHAAGHRVRSEKTNVVIGCSQEISVMLLAALFPKLKASLEADVNIRILICDHDTLPLLLPVGIDILFEYSNERTDENSAKLLEEEIVPVASPSFTKCFADTIAKHPRHWSGIPRLNVAPRGVHWATWSTWFDAHDCSIPEAPEETFENYIHLLEAATAGAGIAIAWNGFINSYLQTGRLVPLRGRWLQTDMNLYATIAPGARKQPSAERVLKELAVLGRELALDGRRLRTAMEGPATEKLAEGLTRTD